MMDQTIRTFSLTKPIDMLAKLEWEMDKLYTYPITQYSPEKTYLAMNATLTAWHISDWLYMSLSPAQSTALDRCAGTQIRSTNALQNWVIRQSGALYMCEQLANASKHLLLSKSPGKRDIPYSTSELEIPLADGQTSYYLMVSDDASSQTIESTIGWALKYWKDLFVEIGLAEKGLLDYPFVQRHWQMNQPEPTFWQKQHAHDDSAAQG